MKNSTKLEIKIFVIIIFFFISSAQFISNCNAEESWTQWGGPGRDFSVSSDGLGKILKKGKFTEKWSRRLGTGNSGIVIEGDFLVTQTRRLSDDGIPSSRESVVCLNKNSGKLIWEYTYDSLALEGQEQYGGGEGPHATACIHDSKVFTLGYAGQVHCFVLETGGLIWKTNLVVDHGADPVQFGFSASPLALGNSIIFQSAGKTSGLIALDANDGSVIWKSGASAFSYASPFVSEIQNRSQIVFQSGNDVQGINPEDGKVLWKFPLRRKGLTNVPTPMVQKPNRIIISGQGVNGSQSIEISKSKNGELEAASDWRSTRVSIFETNTIQIGDLILGGDSFLYGIDANSGKRLWSERGLGKSNILRIDNNALLLTRDGNLIYTQPSNEGIRTLSSYKLFAEESWTAPIIHQNKLFARNRNIITCINLEGSETENRELSVRKLRLGLYGTEGSEEWNSLVKQLNSKAFDQLSFNPLPDLFQWTRAKGETGTDEVRSILGIIESNSPSPSNQKFSEDLMLLYLHLGLQEKVLAQLEKLKSTFPNSQLAESLSKEWNLEVQQRATRFTIAKKPQARSITIAGSFNNWNPQLNYLRKNNDSWDIFLPLEPGKYEYKFVVDGQWILDPNNKNKSRDENGNSNSVVIIP